MNTATIGDALKTQGNKSLTEKLQILKILNNIAPDMINT